MCDNNRILSKQKSVSEPEKLDDPHSSPEIQDAIKRLAEWWKLNESVCKKSQLPIEIEMDFNKIYYKGRIPEKDCYCPGCALIRLFIKEVHIF